jgi:hypothetical protein
MSSAVRLGTKTVGEVAWSFSAMLRLLVERQRSDNEADDEYGDDANRQE